MQSRDARLMPPTSCDQLTSMVIASDSSEVVLQNCEITGGYSGAHRNNPFFAGLGRLPIKKGLQYTAAGRQRSQNRSITGCSYQNKSHFHCGCVGATLYIHMLRAVSYRRPFLYFLEFRYAIYMIYICVDFIVCVTPCGVPLSPSVW